MKPKFKVGGKVRFSDFHGVVVEVLKNCPPPPDPDDTPFYYAVELIAPTDQRLLDFRRGLNLEPWVWWEYHIEKDV